MTLGYMGILLQHIVPNPFYTKYYVSFPWHGIQIQQFLIALRDIRYIISSLRSSVPNREHPDGCLVLGSVQKFVEIRNGNIHNSLGYLPSLYLW